MKPSPTTKRQQLRGDIEPIISSTTTPHINSVDRLGEGGGNMAIAGNSSFSSLSIKQSESGLPSWAKKRASVQESPSKDAVLLKGNNNNAFNFQDYNMLIQ